MSIDDQAPPKARGDLEKRLAQLVAGRTITRILRADDTELALELDDATRIFARVSNGKLDVSVT